jgi:hypothetical protein
MTVPPPPPPPPTPTPPPPPPPPRPGTGSSRRLVHILRAAGLGVLTGLAAAVALAYVFTGSLGPPPAAADVCHDIGADALVTPYAEVSIGVVCTNIDTDLGLPLGGADGFEAVFKAPAPPAGPTTVHPGYLVWESDGCSAPVIGSGPFDFSLACYRHDFGWRNLKAIHGDAVPVWTADNKDRVDAGFLWDMRTRCASLSPVLRIGCDTTARVYYTAVRLNPSGVQGLPWLE